MKHLVIASTIAVTAILALSAPVAAKDNKHGHHSQKAYEKAHKDYHKAERKAAKEDAKAYRKWARGQHIPHEYLEQRYYIDDYRAYRLDAPPNGYRWVRPYEDDSTYYLVQVATGLISQIFGGG